MKEPKRSRAAAMAKSRRPKRIVTPPPHGYKANFLWPHAIHSVEAMGYEFANANTEAYREIVWRELLKRARATSNDSKQP